MTTQEHAHKLDVDGSNVNDATVKIIFERFSGDLPAYINALAHILGKSVYTEDLDALHAALALRYPALENVPIEELIEDIDE